MLTVIAIAAGLFAALCGMFAAGDPNVALVIFTAFCFFVVTLWAVLRQLAAVAADISRAVIRTRSF